MEDAQEMYELARKRVQYAKSRHQVDDGFAMDYVQGIKDEMDEVISEIKEGNAIHLEDELSDVLWDYFNLLRALEELGYIRSGEHVFARGKKKYEERFLAIEQGSSDVWDAIKAKQKIDIAKMHRTFVDDLEKM